MDIFKKNNDVIEGINDSNYSGKITIPDGIKKIAAEAFANCEGITEVELPESLESIGKFAFYNCRNLKSVTFGSGIQSMGRSAFQNCEALESVELHYGIAEIEPWTFAGCKSLTDVDLPNGIKKIGHQAFADCVSLEHFNTLSSGLFHEDALGYEVFQNVNPKCEIIVPLYFDGKYREAEQWNAFAIKVNDERIFSYNGLRYREVEAGKTVAVTTNKDYVGHADIESEILFKDLDLSLTVCKIESSAFYNNSRLTSVHIPKSVTEIGRGAFAGCSNLEYFTSDNVTDTSYVAINGVLFNHSQDTLLAYPAGNDREVYALPAGVQKIEDYAFSSIHSLHRITFPNKEYTMNETAVFENAKLTDCYAFVQDGATALKSQLSKLKPGFKGIVVDSFVFEGLNYKILTDDNEPMVEVADNKDFVGELKMPEKVKFAGVEYRVVGIRRNAFNGNTKITSVSLPNSIKYVEYAAFYKLAVSMKLPSSLEKIGNYAFASNKFTDLTLPSKLKEIGDCAFQSSTVESRKVTIPSSVDTINGNPFICAGVKEIVVNNNAHFEVKNNVLFSKDGLKIIAYPLLKEDKTYTIPEGVTTIGRNFIDNKNLNRLVIPGTVKTLEDGALWSFTNLKVLEVQNTTPPAVGKDSIHEVPTNCFVLVPKGCASKYKAADGWKQIANQIIDEIPSEFTKDKINYKVVSMENKTAEVVRSPDASGAITIPTEVQHCGDTFKVVGIGTNAFGGNSKITDVTLPDTIRYFGDCALTHVSSKKVITLPNSLESIGNRAFWSKDLTFTSFVLPSSLKNIKAWAFAEAKALNKEARIPASVCSIEIGTFQECNIERIEVGGGNTYYKSVDGVLFTKNGETLIEYPYANSRQSYAVPAKVKTIEKEAFCFCKNLKEIILSDTVNSVGDRAFSSNTSLALLDVRATIPPKLDTKSLENFNTQCIVRVPKSCATNYKAAEGWKKIANRIIDDPNPEFPVGNIKYKVLSLVDRTVEVIKSPDASGALNIPSQVPYCGVQFTVVSIGVEAFLYNTVVTSLTLPDTITEIKQRAFDGSSISKLAIPPYTEKIGFQAFFNMSKLVNEIVVPASVKEIGDNAFNESLFKLKVDTGNQYYCAVDNVLFNKKKTELIYYMASKPLCDEYSVPNTVTKIGPAAFQAAKIKHLRLPASLKAFGMAPFWDNQNIKKISVSATTPPTVEKPDIFSRMSSSLVVIVPKGCSAKYKAATGWKEIAGKIREA